MKLRIDMTTRDDGVCVAIAGEIDVDTAPQMRQALLGAVSGRRTVAVDLGAVTFMDSQGLVVLLRARQEAESQGGRLSLERVPTRVMKLLTITGLEPVFIIESTIDRS